jgi:hypothetical protein
MNDKIIFHPILFSFLPILFLFQYNIHEVPITDIIIPLFLSLIPVFLIWIPLKFLTNYKKSSLITSVLILLYVVYSNLHHILTAQSNTLLQIFGKNSILGVIFVALGIVIIIFILKRKSIKNVNHPLNIMSITIVGFLLVSISGYYITNQVDYSLSDYSQLEIPIFETETKPDVYMLLLDEFAGKNTLQIDFDYNLQPFEDRLTERGFVTPVQSFSNYPNTELAVPSFMNMIYLDFLEEELGVDSNDFRLPNQMRQYNTVMKIFKANDYNITTFYGGMGLVPDVRLTDERLCSFGTINPDLRKNFVLTYMPFSYFNEKLLENHQYEKLECFFDTITNVNFEETSPNFIHAHIRLPHEPFIYDEDGNKMSQKNQNDKTAYLSQLKFTEKKILQLIDVIQSRSPDSIILVMSDHGFRPEIDWQNPKPIDHMRGFNTILSFHFPNFDGQLPSEISSVNIFRILFNSNFNTNYEILENRHIWYMQDKPYDFIEVSNSFKDL